MKETDPSECDRVAFGICVVILGVMTLGLTQLYGLMVSLGPGNSAENRWIIYYLLLTSVALLCCGTLIIKGKPRWRR